MLRAGLSSTISQAVRAHSAASLQLHRDVGPCCLQPSLLIPARTVVLLTTLKLVDNSENAKKSKRSNPPYCIKLYKNNKVGKFGDVIKIAHLGKVHNALLLSNRKPSKSLPRYDQNLIILLNEKREPVGTRILTPIPSALRRREGQFSKVIAMATKFI